MALYTRAEYEEEMMECDRRQARMNGMLGREEIDPWDFNACTRENERIRDRAHGRLVASRLIIEDRNKTEKSLLFAWVIITRTKTLCKWSGWGKRGFVTMPPGWELGLVWTGKSAMGDMLYRHPALRDASIMEIKSGQMRRKVKKAERDMEIEEGGEMYARGTWVDVPRAQAKQLQDTGAMVWWDGDVMVEGVFREGATAKVKKEVLEVGDADVGVQEIGKAHSAGAS